MLVMTHPPLPASQRHTLAGCLTLSPTEEVSDRNVSYRILYAPRDLFFYSGTMAKISKVKAGRMVLLSGQISSITRKEIKIIKCCESIELGLRALDNGDAALE